MAAQDTQLKNDENRGPGPYQVLVIDDDLSLRELMEIILRRAGHAVTVAEEGRSGLNLALQNNFDLIVSDILMPGLTGLEVLRGLREAGKEVPLILVSAYANEDTAVEAMREGAFDLIPKPFRPSDLLAVADSALAHPSLEKERQGLAEMVAASQRFGHLVGAAPAMLKVYDLIQRSGQTGTSVLITGESGTGKELVARSLHEHSSRADHNFVAVDCGSLPEHLVESELFGYKKGAFTGADADKTGLVALADQGTLFLDEVAELPLLMQVKLLRLVQEKSFRPLGGGREMRADIRFIAATNKNLEAEVMAGRFREDLYYRLNVINIHLPPLRERASDIPLLAQFFLEKYSRTQNKDVRKLSAYALDILSRYHFPGNVRELENILERSVALEQSNIILPESLRLADFKRTGAPSAPAAPPAWNGRLPAPAENDPGLSNGLDDILSRVEEYYLIQALTETRGVRGRAAALLGISPWRLRIRLVSYGLADQDDFETSLCRRPDIPETLVPEWRGEKMILDQVLTGVERHYLKNALARSAGNKTEAAALLGLSRRSFQHRLERTDYEAWAAGPENSL